MNKLVTVALLMMSGSAAFGQATFQVMRTGGVQTTYPVTLSDDGSVAVGRGWGKTYWSREQGMVTLSHINGMGFYAVSGNGSTLVGEGGAKAWWRASGLPRGTGAPSGLATGTSRDGSVVCFFSPRSAWRPDSGTVVPLSPTESQGYWVAAISSDGGTIVGEVGTISGSSAAWNSLSGVVTPLGTLAPHPSVWVRGVSADGSIKVGYVGGTSNAPPVRWTGTLGWQSLGTIGPLNQSNHGAFSVSGDGTRVVGYSENKAFVWFAPGSPTPDGVPSGMHDLNVLLPQLGADLAGNTLSSAMGISGDGSTIVGNCSVPGSSRVFVATLQPPRCPTDLDSANADGRPDGAVDINDLLRFLLEFGDGGSLADLDNDGVAPRIADGSVDINDLLYFLARFEAGC